jgi:hypothetical protein
MVPPHVVSALKRKFEQFGKEGREKAQMISPRD